MICIPLYHIHSRNIVHRGLKPNDILLKLLGKKEILMIIDFGISYIPKSGSVTTVKDMMSPYYSSIEQLECEDANPSFDIWSLGINLYFLMAKKVPYE